MSIESMMLSNHLILYGPLLLLPSIFPSIRVFSNEVVVCISGQNIGVSASASVLPMNIQDWFPLELTGWISLQSKGLSRVFSNTTFKSISSLALSFLHSTSVVTFWKHFFFLTFANYYPSGSVVKSPLPRQKAQVQSLRQKDSPEEGNGNPLQYSCLGNPMDRGAWWAPVHEVTKESDTT